jgi:hypothetical protein
MPGAFDVVQGVCEVFDLWVDVLWFVLIAVPTRSRWPCAANNKRKYAEICPKGPLSAVAHATIS